MASPATSLIQGTTAVATPAPRRRQRPSRSRRKSTATHEKAATWRTLAVVGFLAASLLGLMVTIAYLSVSG